MRLRKDVEHPRPAAAVAPTLNATMAQLQDLRFRLLSAYGLSSRSHTIRYKQTKPWEPIEPTLDPRAIDKANRLQYCAAA